MKRVLTAVVLIPIVLAILIFAPIWLYGIVVAAVAVLATREYLAMLPSFGLTSYRAVAYIFLALSFGLAISTATLAEAGAYLMGTFFLTMALMMVSGPVFLVLAMRHPELPKAMPSAAASFLARPYITLPLVGLVSLRSGPMWWYLVFYLLVTVWVGDIFAYYTGRAIGRHKLAPRISPGKTWEGAVASLVSATVIGALVLHYGNALVPMRLHPPNMPRVPFTNYPLVNVILLSAGINIAAQLGDLVESMIKRGAGVKDSGTLLPGHGGMLDRIDALLFGALVLWYYAAIPAALSI